MAQPSSESMQFFPFQEIRAKELKYVQEAKKKENDSCILWSQAAQQGVNFAIQMEYSLMVCNHAMRAFCNKDKTALKGLAHYFKLEMDRFVECAVFWSDYQTKRGGCTLLFPLAQPEHDFTSGESDALCVMETKLALERMKYEKLDALHKIAEDAKDKHFEDLIEEKMGAQLLVIKQNADWVNQLRRVGPGHGTWDWDCRLLESFVGKKAAAHIEV